MSFRSLLTAGLFFGGLVAGTAAVQAAPAMPQPGLAGADMVDTVAMHHHRHHRMHRHHSTRHERRMRRMNTMRHGNPNAKNPALRGYQQNLGNTTGGPIDNPSTPAGAVLTVEFTLAGRSFALLNGGDAFRQSEAASLMILCEDQAELDRYWDAFLAEGGTESACGWLKDRWGVSWQITPLRLLELNSDPVHGAKAMAAMMEMRRIDIAALERAIAS